MRLIVVSFALCFLSLPACTSNDARPQAADAGSADAASDGTAPNLDRCDSASYEIFLNFAEASYTSGQDKPSENTSSSLLAQEATLPASTLSASEQAEVVTCVDRLLSLYDLRVTTSEPQGDQYDEIHIGGTAAQIAVPGSIQAVGPLVCGERTPTIGFVFEPIGEQVSPHYPCGEIAFVVGVGAKLQFSPVDACTPMNSMANRDCEEIAFADAEVSCTNGSGGPADCACDQGPTQNEHELMLANYGACPR